MWVIWGNQGSHDFWGWQNCSPLQLPIMHAMPMIGLNKKKKKNYNQIDE